MYSLVPHHPRSTRFSFHLRTWAGLGLLTLSLVGSARADVKQVISSLVENEASAVVAIRYVLSQSAYGQEMQQPMEAQGVVIEPDGLVLAPASELEGSIFTSGFRGPQDGSEGPEFSYSDYRVLVMLGGREQEYEAEVLAKDTEADLAWLKLTEPPSEPMTYIEFPDKSPLDVGDRYFTLGRMSEMRGRAPMVVTGIVGGRMEIPRPGLLASYGEGAVFDESGTPAGLLVSPPTSSQASFGSVTAMMEQFLTRMILPAPVIRRATERAKARFPDPQEESGSPRPEVE